jgi:hypothetical protein
MTFHLFKFRYCIIYVNGDKQMIAEKIIRELYTTEPGQYLGECNSKKSIYEMADGFFIEEISNDIYNNYIKCKGLVKLMTDYWNKIIKDIKIKEIENY